MELECPICSCKLTHLRHHLKNKHKVLNMDERKILLKLARGRVKLKNVACPVCSKKISFLERHLLKTHKDLTVSNHRTIPRTQPNSKLVIVLRNILEYVCNVNTCCYNFITLTLQCH